MKPMFRVEILIAGEDGLSNQMSAMREWLDRQGFEPTIFRYTFGPQGIRFQVDFAAEAEAAAFGKAFGAIASAIPATRAA